jgi:hypothetical protein
MRGKLESTLDLSNVTKTHIEIEAIALK